MHASSGLRMPLDVASVQYISKFRPSPKQLDDHVVQQVVVKWRDLDVQLLNNIYTLDIIEGSLSELLCILLI